MANRLSEKKVVTNEEYSRAYADPQNRKIMRAASTRSNRFRELPLDVRTSCCMNALWLTLQHHKEGFGQKFTTNLYRFVVWECGKELKKEERLRSRNCQLSDDFVDLFTIYDKSSLDIQDCISKLPSKLSKVIRQKYFQSMTLDEIGKANGYSKQMANVNLSKAIEKLRLIMNKCV